MNSSGSNLGASDVGCVLTFQVATPAGIVLQVAAARSPGTALNERLEIINNTVPLPAEELAGAAGGRQHLVRAQPGTLSVTYQARVTPGVVTAEPVTAGERVSALRPSRYCPSDRFVGFAQRHCGDSPATLERVRAICAYVWQHVEYVSGASGPSTDAVDTLLRGQGVCRDVAHLVTALCRAVNIPARIAAVYAPGLSPMDLHAVVETEIEGVWQVWDATRLAPRCTLVRIATGRDAADTAFATVISGQAELQNLEITAVAGDDLPFDDHESLVALG